MCADREGSCQSVPCLGYCHKHKSWPKWSHAWLHTHTLSHQLTVARSSPHILTDTAGACQMFKLKRNSFKCMNKHMNTHWRTCMSDIQSRVSDSTCALCTLPSSLRAHTHNEERYGLCGLFWNFQRLIARQQEELLYPVAIQYGERIKRWRGWTML